jgi:tight adherence protein B
MTASALAFAAGCLALTAAVETLRATRAQLAQRLPQAASHAAALATLIGTAGRDGREPGAPERRRLLAAGGAAAFAAGTVAAGPLAGAAAACAGPWAAGRVLAARRTRHRREVDQGAPALATAVADALSGGRSLRGALSEAAPGVPGAAGAELRRVGAELDLGAATEDALEAMRARVRSHAIDSIVAAALLNARAGGDLARLLRDCARAFEDHARLEAEARAATAQARFTALIVILLPLGGGLFAELASPGWFAGLASSFLTLWLAGIALALQVTAGVAIRRIGRVRA